MFLTYSIIYFWYLAIYCICFFIIKTTIYKKMNIKCFILLWLFNSTITQLYTLIHCLWLTSCKKIQAHAKKKCSSINPQLIFTLSWEHNNMRMCVCVCVNCSAVSFVSLSILSSEEVDPVTDLCCEERRILVRDT